MKEKHFSYWRYLRFIAVFMLLYPISVLAAQGHISVKGQFSLKEAIQFIEKNSEYTFFYKDSDLRDNTKKNINCSGTIEEVLKKLFTDSGVNYIIKGNEVIFKVNKTEKVEQQQQQKKRVITGTVIDGDLKEPIIGASVWLKNSSSGAVTNLDGKYTITVEGIGGVLEFSYIGMKKQEIVIGDQSVINVTLSADTKKLDEVVVVGYGHQKKESVVGAISSLDVGELNIPGSNISNVLAGQLAGVVSMQASGEPGKNSASDFYIRGIASFKGNSTPLVLVDGIERELDLVDVDDIATFSILKDASASAVYGVRGANGVILITTRKEQKVNLVSMYVQKWVLKLLHVCPKWLILYSGLKCIMRRRG
jgi:TonB-dependent SusC/RagA subfamily outer membrane receptor